MNKPLSGIKRIVILDIDGLDYRVFTRALNERHLPNIARLVGGAEFEQGVLYDAISCAPSITYCCQASSFTGAHPYQHQIAANWFFDRFGRMNEGKPRKYEFDFRDAPAVFMNGLAGETIHPGIETIYETGARYNMRSVVTYNMYAHGSHHWIKPGLDDWADFISLSKFGFGENFDQSMINDLIEFIDSGERPGIMTAYFFGLDHESHLKGPRVQFEYLEHVVDRQVGELVAALKTRDLYQGTLFVLFSDHGHQKVETDDTHILKVGYLFDREMGHIFDAAGRDVQDHPFEGPNCDALMTPCGGIGQVYLRRIGGAWRDVPRFKEDVLDTAQVFWHANQTGEPWHEIKGALEAVLVRDSEHQGWYAPYQAYTPEGLVSVSAYQSAHPEINWVDAENRLRNLSSPVTGDILLMSNYSQGYAFTLVAYKGQHGGISDDDSHSVLAFCLPDAPAEEVEQLRRSLDQAIQQRCQQEGGRMISNVDMAFGIRTLMGWDTPNTDFPLRDYLQP